LRGDEKPIRWPTHSGAGEPVMREARLPSLIFTR